MLAYREVFGKELKTQASNPLKFTAGTDPSVKRLIVFLVDENASCP